MKKSNIFAVCCTLLTDFGPRSVCTESHVEELSGSKKKAEQLSSFVRTSTGLIANLFTQVKSFGRVDVRFAEPFSLLSHIKKETSRPDNPLNVMDSYVKRHISYSVGYRTLYECNRVSVVEPAALVAVSEEEKRERECVCAGINNVLILPALFLCSHHRQFYSLIIDVPFVEAIW